MYWMYLQESQQKSHDIINSYRPGGIRTHPIQSNSMLLLEFLHIYCYEKLAYPFLLVLVP